jgi:hypothetical protein
MIRAVCHTFVNVYTWVAEIDLSQELQYMAVVRRETQGVNTTLSAFLSTRNVDVLRVMSNIKINNRALSTEIFMPLGMKKRLYKEVVSNAHLV